jgi:hypothetical protein
MPIINLMGFSYYGLFRLNTLAIEPSHAARLLTVFFYGLLKLSQYKNEGYPLTVHELWSGHKWAIIAFLYTMICMGSGTAFVCLGFISLYFLKREYIIVVLIVAFSFYMLVPYIDYEPLTRAINIFNATLTGDTETITETPIEVIEIPLDYDENRLPKIYSIEIKNESYAGELITGYGEKIYSTKTMILKPKISYKSYANRDYKFYIKWIKPDGTIRRTNFSPAGYSQSKSCKLSYGEGTYELAGWGSKTKGYWKEGNYAIEIWCEGTLLKRKEFTIYKSK